MSTIGDILVRIGLVDDLSGNLDKTTRKMRSFGRDMAAAGMALTPLSVGIIGAGVAAVKVAGDYDALKRGLDTVTGSATETKRQLAELKEVAKLPGLGFREAVQGSIQLQAVGFSADRAAKILREFGNALAAVGRGREDLSEVGRQLGQLASRGKVTADNLKPIIERVPQAAKIIKQEFGTIDTEQLQKLGISSEVFIQRLLDGLSRLPRATGGIKNEIENFGDTFQQAMADAGEAVVPFATVVLQQFASVAQAVGNLGKDFRKLPEEVRSAVTAITAIFVLTPIATTLGGKLIAGWADLVKFIRGPVIAAVIAFGSILKLTAAGLAAQFAALGAAFPALLASLTAAGIAASVYGLIDLASKTWDLIQARKAAKKQEDDLTQSVFRLEYALRSQGADISGLSAQYRTGKISLEQYLRALQGIAIEMGKAKAATQGLASAQMTLEEALKFLGGDKDISVTGLTKEYDKAKAVVKALTDAQRNGAKISAEAWEQANKKLKDAREALFGKPVDTSKQFSSLGLRDLPKELAEAEAALRALGASGKLSGERLEEAAGKIEKLRREIRLAAETGSTEPRKFVDPRTERDIERASTAFQRAQQAVKAARDESDEINKLINDLSLIEAGAADFASADARIFYSLQQQAAGLDPAFNAANAALYGTAESLRAVGEAASNIGLGQVAENIGQVYADIKALGIKGETDLAKTIAAARRVAEASQADIGIGTRLAARVKLYEAELQLLRESLLDQDEEQRASTERQIADKERLLKADQKALDRIKGNHKRNLDAIETFWRGFGRQVSTILTDLSRQIVDVLFPRSTGSTKDVAAITELGIRAGVSGKQLEELAAIIEALAKATGTDFRSAATGAADVFRAFGVSVAEQIPLLRAFFAISQTTGATISELFSGVSKNAELFRALGLSAGDAAALIGSLSKSGYDTSDVLGSLEKALKELASKGFTDPARALRDLIQRIKDAGTESEATALAVKYFGDNAQKMVAIIRGGKLEFVSLTTSIDKTSDSIEQAAEKSKDLSNEQSKLGQIFGEVWRSVIRAVIESSIASLIKFIKESKTLQALWKDIKDVFLSVGRAIGIIGPASTAAATTATTATTAAGGAAQAAASAGGSAGGAAAGGSASGAAAGSASGNLAGNILAGVNAAATIAGVIEAARQEGTLNAIEHNTRYAMIYLGDQGDSVLESLHIIRNVATDYMAYVWDVQTSYYQKICAAVEATAASVAGFVSVPVPRLAAAGTGESIPISDMGVNVEGDINISVDGSADPQATAQAVARHLTARGIRHRTRVR